MFSNWFPKKMHNKVGFEDVLYALSHKEDYLLINTLSNDAQDCLIQNTLSMDLEEHTINQMINQSNQCVKKIIVYGKNGTHDNVDNKYQQLIHLGFSEVYIYSGGLFEWMLLQDIYGVDHFPTTSIVTDILKYRPRGRLQYPRIS
tara:strand:+ start:56 stop:490 length:435 start_codon:yes stop_codon:yes gene_type:complete